MAIQDSGKAAQVLIDWCAKHPNLKNSDKNIQLLSSWIQKNHGVAGELILTAASLDMGFLALSGQLEFYPSAEDQQRIAQLSQQTTELAAEKQRLADEAERERKRIEAYNLRESRQEAHRPGPSSAFSNRDDAARRANEEAQARQAVREQAERNALYAQFRQELVKANQITVTIPGTSMVKAGATESARANARRQLAQKYPQFADQIKS